MIEFRNHDQMKAYFKKEAKRLNISVNNAYNTFIARTFLQKISKYNDKEILVKGSSAETVYLGKLVRAITDIDIASIYKYNESMPVIVNAINDSEEKSFNIQLSEGFQRTQTGIYKLCLDINYEKFNHKLKMDLQENYSRLIKPEVKVMPSIFEGDEPFEVYLPSFEEYLAEKLCIIIETNKEDVLNTRVKDFYDIYQLHGGKYDYDKLTEYFGKMIKLRNKIKLEEATTTGLNHEFIMNHQDLWEKAKKSYDFIDKEIDLDGAVYYTRAVLREQLQKNGQEMPIIPLIKK